MPEEKSARASILVVEDEIALASAIKNQLQENGYQVSVASDGEEAVQIIQKNLFDLILLDILMPKMNGFSVLEEIQKMKLNCPIIVLSNISPAEAKKTVMTLGATAIYQKVDTSLETLVKIVAKHLKQ